MNDRNALLTSCEPPKMFTRFIQLMFVPIKEFDVKSWSLKPKQAEMEARRRGETGERLKVPVCCLSQLHFLLVADGLYSEPAEFIRSAVGD